MPKKNYVSGFGDQDPDAASFLKPDANGGTDPFATSDYSDTGYNARFDDGSGHIRGANHDDSGRILRNKLPYERTADVSDRLAGIIDSDEGMGSGNKLLGGGGPVSKGGAPRFAPKTGPRTNARG
jgi:hypothetical protein